MGDKLTVEEAFDVLAKKRVSHEQRVFALAVIREKFNAMSENEETWGFKLFKAVAMGINLAAVNDSLAKNSTVPLHSPLSEEQLQKTYDTSPDRLYALAFESKSASAVFENLYADGLVDLAFKPTPEMIAKIPPRAVARQGSEVL